MSTDYEMDEESYSSSEVNTNDHYEIPTYPPLDKPHFRSWEYLNRRQSQEIIPNLFLGPLASVTKASREDLVRVGISHIVAVRSPTEARIILPHHQDIITYLTIELQESPFESILPHMKGLTSFLDNCLNGGGKALIYSNACMNRAPAFAIAYIMWRYGVDSEKGFLFVQSKRFCISLSETILLQLKDYEPIVSAIHTVPLQLPQHNNKRGGEEEIGPPHKIQLTQN